MPQDPEPMNVEAVVERLNEALALQHRSALLFTHVAGSIEGYEYQALASRLWQFAEAALADARRLVEKIVALGGEPTTSVAPMDHPGEPDKAIDRLIDAEGEALTALHAVIPETGQEPGSEALEHRIEHVIMRKQEQVDTLIRARRRS